MSRQQKFVLIALALLALVFFLLAGWGLNQPSCEGNATDCARGYKPGSAMSTLRGVFSKGSPRVKLKQERYAFDSSGTMTVDIPPSEDKIRTLRLRRLEGTIDLSVFNADGKNDIDLSDQEDPTRLPREADEPDERQQISFAVTSGGGRLKIECITAPCLLATD